MSKPVPITRLDRSAIDLRREASGCSDAALVRRLLAIALVLEGRPRTEAAEACGMDRQTLRDWVHHYILHGKYQSGLRSAWRLAPAAGRQARAQTRSKSR